MRQEVGQRLGKGLKLEPPGKFTRAERCYLPCQRQMKEDRAGKMLDRWELP